MRPLAVTVLMLLSMPLLAQEGPALEIELRGKVTLVHQLVKAKGQTIDLGLALEGKLLAIVRNTGEVPVTIEDLEAANFAFLDAASGKPWPLVHPCAVVGACNPEGHIGRTFVTLQPGQEHEVHIDEFGCSGSNWKAPPPGEYDLVYRVKIVAEGEPLPPWCAKQGTDSNPSDVAGKARDVLGGKEFWQGALSSKPLRFHFKRPHKRFL
jgi:hypothetical protein